MPAWLEWYEHFPESIVLMKKLTYIFLNQAKPGQWSPQKARIHFHYTIAQTHINRKKPVCVLHWHSQTTFFFNCISTTPTDTINNHRHNLCRCADIFINFYINYSFNYHKKLFNFSGLMFSILLVQLSWIPMDQHG